jgi:ABC-2 type transport system ATP-binding protein
MTTSPSELAIEADELTKAFGDHVAVDGIELTVPKGTVFGFLGPNGAGKTTTIRMLATLLRPDSGTARVFGHDVVREAAAVRERVSLTGQFASVDNELTGRENLVLLGKLLGHSWRGAKARAAELLDAFGLAEAGGRQVGSLSGGMRRRLDIAASLIVMPQLLFLDEPTTGLDPRSRRQIWEIVRAIVDDGTTVLLTTQYLDEADQLADRIGLIDGGKLIADGTTGQLKASVGSGSLKVRLLDPERRLDARGVLARELAAPIRLDSDPAALSARLASTNGGRELAARAARAVSELSRSGIGVSEFALAQPSLDEVFLALTGDPAGARATTKEEAR